MTDASTDLRSTLPSPLPSPSPSPPGLPAPWVVGTSRPEGLVGLLALPVRNRVPDLIEARLDLATAPDGVSAPDLAPHLRTCHDLEGTGSAVLVTIRRVEDGGKWTGDGDRWPWFRQAAPLVSWLDIEVGSEIAEAVVAAAHASGRRVILSHHDFEGTPGDDALDAIAARGFSLGADVVKIATFVQSLEHHRQLVSWLHGRRDPARPLALIGMGPLGTPLRTYLPCIGSHLTYGYLDDVVAPGQLHARELVSRLTQDCPSYAELRRQR